MIGRNPASPTRGGHSAGASAVGVLHAVPSAVSATERDIERLLRLLSNLKVAATFAMMRDSGVRAPAHALYELSLAGYRIDRIPSGPPGTSRTLGYRLDPSQREHALRELGDDPTRSGRQP